MSLGRRLGLSFAVLTLRLVAMCLIVVGGQQGSLQELEGRHPAGSRRVP